ncbi:MAG: hypothetical protein M5U29_17240 [Anaerolineae bacterium]|nr:hypothetical protein [Anaerolineae bacterium]
MQPFDEGYLKRREKQIQELYELRATIGACLVTAVIAALIGVALLTTGYGTLAAISLVISALFGMGTIFITADYSAKKAADQAVQKEYQQMALYGLIEEKAKRGNREFRLADDGEIVLEQDLDDDRYHESQQE